MSSFDMLNRTIIKRWNKKGIIQTYRHSGVTIIDMLYQLVIFPNLVDLTE